MWSSNGVSPELLEGCQELALSRFPARVGACHADWLCLSSEACTTGALARVSRRSWLPPLLLLEPARLRRCRLLPWTCSMSALCQGLTHRALLYVNQDESQCMAATYRSPDELGTSLGPFQPSRWAAHHEAMSDIPGSYPVLQRHTRPTLTCCSPKIQRACHDASGIHLVSLPPALQQEN